MSLVDGFSDRTSSTKPTATSCAAVDGQHDQLTAEPEDDDARRTGSPRWRRRRTARPAACASDPRAASPHSRAAWRGSGRSGTKTSDRISAAANGARRCHHGVRRFGDRTFGADHCGRGVTWYRVCRSAVQPRTCCSHRSKQTSVQRRWPRLARPLLVLVDEGAHRLEPEVRAGLGRRRQQHVADIVAKLAPEPGVERARQSPSSDGDRCPAESDRQTLPAESPCRGHRRA